MPRLDPREWCSRADVRAATEGEIVGGAQTCHVEMVGVHPRCRDALSPKFADVLQRLAALSLVRLIASGASAEARRGTAASESPLTLGTIHSAKVLQFRAVSLMCADLRCGPDNAERHRNGRALLYVGLTRAQTFLRICWTRDTALTAEVEAAIASIEYGDPPDYSLDGGCGQGINDPPAEPFCWGRGEPA